MATITNTEALEAALAAALIRATTMIHDETREREVIDALEAGDVEGAIDAIRFEIGEAELEHVLPQQLRSAFETAGLEARQSLQLQIAAEVGVKFDLLNPEALNWIRSHAAALIGNFGESSMQAVRALIQRAYTDRLNPRALARMIRESGIGLDARRLTALENYRRGLVESKTPPGQIEAKVRKYGERLLRDRARLIARTEIAAASNAGNRELWRQANAKGLIGDGAEVEWQTTGQENVCLGCDDLDGETVPVGGTFSNGDEGPPAHPACSCVLVLHPFGKAAGDLPPKGKAWQGWVR